MNVLSVEGEPKIVETENQFTVDHLSGVAMSSNNINNGKNNTSNNNVNINSSSGDQKTDQENKGEEKEIEELAKQVEEGAKDVVEGFEEVMEAEKTLKDDPHKGFRILGYLICYTFGTIFSLTGYLSMIWIREEPQSFAMSWSISTIFYLLANASIFGFPTLLRSLFNRRHRVNSSLLFFSLTGTLFFAYQRSLPGCVVSAMAQYYFYSKSNIGGFKSIIQVISLLVQAGREAEEREKQDKEKSKNNNNKHLGK